MATKYGTKEEYLELIRTLQASGIEAYADIVFNHMMGADETEVITANVKAWDNRLYEMVNSKEVEVWTKFTFPGREGQYDDYQWTWKNFSGVDYDQRSGYHEILQFPGKNWKDVDDENVNYDYLMGADVDFDEPETEAQLEKWGKWFFDTTNIDGFRLDAVKHIDFGYFQKWLKEREKQMGKNPFVVGEYWSDNLDKLKSYIDRSGEVVQLFDVPLHFNFYQAATSGGNYDMRRIFDNTLVKSRASHAVTFVDNHDTQEGQSLQSWIPGWFKEQAYSLILLRQQGTPTVFWGDLYGIPERGVDPVGFNLRRMMQLRSRIEILSEYDYFDHHDVIGWTNTMNFDGKKTGMATILTNATYGSKYMVVDPEQAGKSYVDLLGHRMETLRLDGKGGTTFPVNDGSISVWVEKSVALKLETVSTQLASLATEIESVVAQLAEMAELLRG